MIEKRTQFYSVPEDRHALKVFSNLIELNKEKEKNEKFQEIK